MKGETNFKLYNKFKIDVVGGYYGIDDLKMLEEFLESLKNKKIPFILLSTRKSGKDVIQICKKYAFIKDFIISCEDSNEYKNCITKYSDYAANILLDIKQVYGCIKSYGVNYYKKGKPQDHFIFSLEDIERNKQLEHVPVISAYEYDNCYFLIHRAYAHFFKDMNDRNDVIFTKSYFNIIKESFAKLDLFKIRDKESLYETIKSFGK